MKKSIIFNIPVNDIKKNKLLQICRQNIKKNKKIFIVTLNSLMAIKNADLIIPDGYGIILAGNFFNKPIKNHLPGIDLAYDLLGMAHENKFSVFLLGGRWGVIAAAHKALARWFPEAKFLGRYYGYFRQDEEKNVISGINKIKPDILLVGMGTPKQEIWINEHLKNLDAKIIMGIGGSFDVFAGSTLRAPEKWRKKHMEWLFRSITSPLKIINLFKIFFYCLIMLYFKLLKKG